MAQGAAGGGGVEIVGQGLAGTLLAWACEWAGLDFRVWDPGRGDAASLAGAGLITPVTGRRLAPAPGFAADWEVAEQVYSRIGDSLGEPLWRRVVVERRLSDPAERRMAARRLASCQLTPWVQPAPPGAGDPAYPEGPGVLRLHPAAQVNLERLLAASRAHWRAEGRLVPEAWGPAQLGGGAVATVLCAGAGVLTLWPDRRWQPACGESLDLEGELPPDLVRNDGHWLAGMGAGRLRCGATYRQGAVAEATTEARGCLEQAARRLHPGVGRVVGHRAGVRVSTPDRRPVAGWTDAGRRLGVLGGLGSKGVLTAPRLARQWIDVLQGRAEWPAWADDPRA